MIAADLNQRLEIYTNKMTSKRDFGFRLLYISCCWDSRLISACFLDLKQLIRLYSTDIQNQLVKNFSGGLVQACSI